jgi:prepilin-type N-terminal cleavage/methylation domain-containing protein
MTARPRPAAGFTLLEVVLALSALALLTGICYAAFSLATRAVERGTNAVVTEQRLRAVTDVIMRQVKSAVPYPLRDSEDGILPYFNCTSNSLGFITAAGQLSGGLPAWVRYTIQGDPPELWLYESTVFDPDMLGRDVPDEETIVAAKVIDGFTSFSFSCLDLTNGWGQLLTTDEETSQALALSVAVRFEGLPGLSGVLEQKIPVVLGSYSEDSGLVDEDEEERIDALGDIDEEDVDETGPDAEKSEDASDAADEDAE